MGSRGHSFWLVESKGKESATGQLGYREVRAGPRVSPRGFSGWIDHPVHRPGNHVFSVETLQRLTRQTRDVSKKPSDSEVHAAKSPWRLVKLHFPMAIRKGLLGWLSLKGTLLQHGNITVDAPTLAIQKTSWTPAILLHFTRNCWLPLRFLSLIQDRLPGLGFWFRSRLTDVAWALVKNLRTSRRLAGTLGIGLSPGICFSRKLLILVCCLLPC